MLQIFEDAPAGFVAAVQTAVGTTRYLSQPSISLVGQGWDRFFYTTTSNTKMNLEKMKFLLEIVGTDIFNPLKFGRELLPGTTSCACGKNRFQSPLCPHYRGKNLGLVR